MKGRERRNLMKIELNMSHPFMSQMRLFSIKKLLSGIFMSFNKEAKRMKNFLNDKVFAILRINIISSFLLKLLFLQPHEFTHIQKLIKNSLNEFLNRIKITAINTFAKD